MSRFDCFAHRRNAERTRPLRFVAIGMLLFLAAAGCDSAEDPPCALEVDETHTRSASLVDAAGQVAIFEFQQIRKRYAQDGCRRTEPDVDEVRLLIRNLTNCRLSVSYRVSLISGFEGWTVEGAGSVQHGAIGDQGVIQRGGISIEGAQVVLDGAASRTDCR